MVNGTRIGLSVDGDSVSAVAVRRGAIVWSARAAWRDDEAISAVVAELLGGCPAVKGARVVVAFGTTRVRVKALHGLEHVARADLVFRAVHENPDRFFLSTERGTAVSHVARAGSAWYAAAFAAQSITSVEDGCRAAGASLEMTVVAPSALPPGIGTNAAGEPPRGFEEYADAYAAACHTTNAALALPSDARTARAARRRSATRIALACAVGLAALANLLAPTLSADLRRRAFESVLAYERDSLRPVVATMSELATTSNALSEIERFRSSRIAWLSVLESLARKLPDSTAVLSLRADTASATIVMVTRSGPGVLQSLASIDGLKNPQVLGAFSREDIGGLPFERVAVRANLARARAGQ